MTASSQLAQYVTDLTWDDIPTAQIDQMKRFLFDYLGIAVRGSRSESGEIARAYVTEQEGVAQATVIGQLGRVPAGNAAFANAISEHSIEMDDVDELALFHYGPPVISAALAVAQWKSTSGRDFLVALVAGCEVFNRLSRATNNDLRNRGFHTTPTVGVFAATAAAGRLLGLTADELTNAFGLAGAQASGLMEMYGPSMQKRFNPGPTARNGVTAAILAGKGFTGADTILEGERGFGVAFAGKFDAAALADLGEFTVIVEHKPYSAARPIHNAIDCVFDVSARATSSAADIESIVIRRHPDWAHYHLNAAPRTFHEAQVSLLYSVGAAFVLGSALPEQYSDANLARNDIRAVIDKISIETDPGLTRGVSCDMTVTYADGTSIRSVVDYPKGSPQNPMSREELRSKFDALTGGILVEGAADRVQSSVDDLEALGDINALVDLLEVAQ